MAALAQELGWLRRAIRAIPGADDLFAAFVMSLARCYDGVGVRDGIQHALTHSSGGPRHSRRRFPVRRRHLGRSV